MIDASLPNLPEPGYYVSTAFSGVGFVAPGDPIPQDGTLVPPKQVAPEIRIEGMAWLNERETSEVQS